MYSRDFFQILLNFFNGGYLARQSRHISQYFQIQNNKYLTISRYPKPTLTHVVKIKHLIGFAKRLLNDF